MENNIDTRSI